MPAKTNAQEVARLLMKHCGCHQVKIFDLSSKHRKLMDNKTSYNPSHLNVCVPVCYPDDLRTSDGSKKSVVPKITLRANKHNDPLRRTIIPSDLKKDDKVDGKSKAEVDGAGNPVLNLRRRELLDEKSKPFDDFLLSEKCSSKTEERLGASRSPVYKPRQPDAFNTPLRIGENPPRRPIMPSKIKKPVNGEKSKMTPVNLRNLTISSRFEIKDDHSTSGRYLVLKRHCLNRRINMPDRTAEVIEYSSDKVILYQDKCDCKFCSLLKHYHGCALLFAREFTTDKGHGFFPRILLKL